MRDVLTVVAKTLLGGALVLVFAAPSAPQGLSYKRAVMAWRVDDRFVRLCETVPHRTGARTRTR